MVAAQAEAERAFKLAIIKMMHLQKAFHPDILLTSAGSHEDFTLMHQNWGQKPKHRDGIKLHSRHQPADMSDNSDSDAAGDVSADNVFGDKDAITPVRKRLRAKMSPPTSPVPAQASRKRHATEPASVAMHPAKKPVPAPMDPISDNIGDPLLATRAISQNG